MDKLLSISTTLNPQIPQCQEQSDDASVTIKYSKYMECFFSIQSQSIIVLKWVSPWNYLLCPGKRLGGKLSSMPPGRWVAHCVLRQMFGTDFTRSGSTQTLSGACFIAQGGRRKDSSPWWVEWALRMPRAELILMTGCLYWICVQLVQLRPNSLHLNPGSLISPIIWVCYLHSCTSKNEN